MKKSRLVIDANGMPIETILHPVSTIVLPIKAVGDATTVTAVGAFTQVECIRLCSTEACLILLSDVGTQATQPPVLGETYIPAFIPQKINLGGKAYLSCIKMVGGAGAGSLYITIMN
jgi:hypothetical protein